MKHLFPWKVRQNTFTDATTMGWKSNPYARHGNEHCTCPLQLINVDDLTRLKCSQVNGFPEPGYQSLHHSASLSMKLCRRQEHREERQMTISQNESTAVLITSS